MGISPELPIAHSPGRCTDGPFWRQHALIRWHVTTTNTSQCWRREPNLTPGIITTLGRSDLYLHARDVATRMKPDNGGALTGGKTEEVVRYPARYRRRKWGHSSIAELP